MKRTLLTLFLLISLIPAFAQQWSAVGPDVGSGSGISVNDAWNVDVATDGTQTFSSYFESLVGNEIFVKSFNATTNSWENIPSAGLDEATPNRLNSDVQGYLESEIAISPSGELWIAYISQFDQEFADFIFIKNSTERLGSLSVISFWMGLDRENCAYFLMRWARLMFLM